MENIDVDLIHYTSQSWHNQYKKILYNNKMEYFLEKIARNTEPKSSFYILLSEKSARIRTMFNPLIQLDQSKKYEMALVSLDTYYSFPNIDTTNNNFRYSSDNGVTWFNINVPEGSYEIVDINEYIQRIMKNNGHYNTGDDEYYITIEPNNNTLKSVLNISVNYKVDFTTANSIRTVLGYNKQIYSAGYNESENIVNIISVNSLRVTSNVIGASYSNGSTENIIYSFFPNVGPGYKIIEVPVNLVYIPVTLYTISLIEATLTDQNGKLINLRGEELSIRFHIREA
jgi:hypothetical protein